MSRAASTYRACKRNLMRASKRLNAWRALERVVWNGGVLVTRRLTTEPIKPNTVAPRWKRPRLAFIEGISRKTGELVRAAVERYSGAHLRLQRAQRGIGFSKQTAAEQAVKREIDEIFARSR